jgi:hypothetical protein
MNPLETEEMLLILESLSLGEKYRQKVCVKCLGTKQQQVRDCALLRGYSRPSCKNMRASVDNKLREKDKKLMQKIMGEVVQLRDSQDDGINSELFGVWQSLEDLYY